MTRPHVHKRSSGDGMVNVMSQCVCWLVMMPREGIQVPSSRLRERENLTHGTQLTGSTALSCLPMVQSTQKLLFYVGMFRLRDYVACSTVFSSSATAPEDRRGMYTKFIFNFSQSDYRIQGYCVNGCPITRTIHLKPSTEAGMHHVTRGT